MSVGYKIQYGTQPIEFTVVRRERRTMQISVLPDSSVEVVAPVSVVEKDIVTRMHKRAGWIHKQMRFFQQYQPRTPDRRFAAGETHLYLGRRYRLKIVRGEQSAIKLKRGVIEVHTRFPSRKAAICEQVEQWLLGIVGVNMMQLQSEWLIAEGPARVSSHGYFTD